MEDERFENILVDAGYHLKFIKNNSEFYIFKIYLDNGQGYGEYKIPICPICIDDTDILLWIKEQFYKLHPELFTKEREWQKKKS